MKATIALILLPLMALANPLPEPEPEVEAEFAHIDKRAITCALTGSNVKYHRKASTTSIADGEFGAKGTKVPFSCYKTGESVNGNV